MVVVQPLIPSFPRPLRTAEALPFFSVLNIPSLLRQAAFFPVIISFFSAGRPLYVFLRTFHSLSPGSSSIQTPRHLFLTFLVQRG